MKIRKKTIRNKLIISLFIVILCMNSFAAVVSDNDGSAFITKPEFDSLKSNFQSQLDGYSSNIDNKINNAIASYLEGVKNEKTYKQNRDDSFNWTFPIVCINNSEWNNVTSKYYDYELPNIKDIFLQLRGYGHDAVGQSWNATGPLSAGSSSRATGGAVCLAKTWWAVPEKYNELIAVSDSYKNRTIGTTTFKAYEIQYVGKGRHVTENYSFGWARDYGHINSSTKNYWGYTGVIGIGVSGAVGIRGTMTTGTFANWTTSQWTRTGGVGIYSSLGWGAQSTNAFVLPAAGLTLDGARSWAATYTNANNSIHGEGTIGGKTDSSTRANSFAWQAGNNVRQWIFTGNSDSPATSVYGWCFDMVKPQSATEKFEGYIMHYTNDIAMTSVADGTWYGFHSWVPHWFWKFKAAGSIGTAPSTSQFSKLPAKQVYYYDSDGKVHYLDEGLFLLNFKDSVSQVVFNAKWDKIDTSLPAGQKIRLKIASTPFGSDHDSSKDLKYKINDATTAAANQQVAVGSSLKITVECNEDAKQLYMMWEPVTSGAYLGLSEISEFTVTVSG